MTRRGARRLLSCSLRLSCRNGPGLVQRALRRGSDRLKRFRLTDCDVRQHLAVEIEPRQLEAVHELRVGEAMLARTGIDPLDPQGAKVALAIAPVAIGIAQRLLDLLDRDPIGSAATAAITLCEIEDF